MVLWAVTGQSLRKFMEFEYQIDVICNFLLTVRLMERGGCEAWLARLKI